MRKILHNLIKQRHNRQRNNRTGETMFFPAGCPAHPAIEQHHKVQNPAPPAPPAPPGYPAPQLPPAPTAAPAAPAPPALPAPPAPPAPPAREEPYRTHYGRISRKADRFVFQIYKDIDFFSQKTSREGGVMWHMPHGIHSHL